MPKQKTHKGLSKRVKITANGKIKHRVVGGGHLMSSKSAKRRRHISTPGVLVGVYAHKMKVKLGG
jgi:large subunit ribosomal protein L35